MSPTERSNMYILIGLFAAVVVMTVIAGMRWR